MNTRYYVVPAIAATLMALASTAALADDPTVVEIPSTFVYSRSEVKAEVRQARKAHELVAAGEAGAPAVIERGTVVARSAVKAEVLAARARGELLPAGDLNIATASQPRRALPSTALVAVR